MHVLSIPEKYIPSLEKIIASGIPVVAMESSPIVNSRIVTVGMDGCISGCLAGELISKLVHSSGSAVRFSQEMNLGDESALNARNEIMQRRSDIDVEIVPLNPDSSDAYSIIKSYIEKKPAAVYASCARNTRMCINAMKESGKCAAFIGSEIFDESYHALQSGILDAVIDNRPAYIGYTALKLLIEHLVKKMALKNSYRLQPILLLKSNSTARYEQVYRHVDVDLSR